MQNLAAEKPDYKITYVLDTNVLLNDAEIIDKLPDTLIIIPQTVLAEIDKIKFFRADMDLKFRARRLSRKLFEYTKKGRLSEGIILDNGSTLKVMIPEPTGEIPAAIKSKSADDQIIALAYHLGKQNGGNVTILTSDINMIIKAQAIGVHTELHEYKEKGQMLASLKSKRWQKRLFAVFAALLVLFLSIPMIRNQLSPANSMDKRLEIFHNQEKSYKQVIEKNPNDINALISLGNLYFEWKQWNQSIYYYGRSVQLNPRKWDTRVDMAISLFNIGNTTGAVNSLKDVIKLNPKHAMAHYNLGAIYAQTGNYREGVTEFEAYKKLDPKGRFIVEADSNIQRLKLQIEQSPTSGADIQRDI